MPLRTPDISELDADGCVPNGYVEPYPHVDFDGPCTCQRCFPEAYPDPNIWTCMGRLCTARLHQPGYCVACVQDENF